MCLLDTRLGDERKMQLSLPLLDESVFLRPSFTVCLAAAKVSGAEGVVVVASSGGRSQL